MLSSISHLEEYIGVVNEGQRGMVETIVEQFKQRVLENIDQFAKQTIHGDFNEQNILVGKTLGSSDYKVTGVIDFGDTQHNCLLFELAIALSYIMLTTGEIETGGYFLAGYKMTRLIPEHEMQVLKVKVHSRKLNSVALKHFITFSFASVHVFAKVWSLDCILTSSTVTTSIY